MIFDEASQIEIGDYLPLLVRFRSTLQKLVFIGDDKQREPPIHIIYAPLFLMLSIAPIVAPYGTGDIPDLESIFEKRHLQENAIFLDTQCESAFYQVNG
jgi:superfamily I DNA and/or RNA helicase